MLETTRNEKYRNIRIKHALYRYTSICLVLILILIAQTTVFAFNKYDIKNIAPTADLQLIKKKVVDVVVVTDFEGTKNVDLKSQLNEWRAQMLSNDVNIKFFYVADKKVFGQQSKVITDKLYVRRAWATYHEVGNGTYSYSNSYTTPSWDRDTTLQLGNMEQLWGDISTGFVPSISDTVTALNWNFSYTGYSNYYSGMYGGTNETGYNFIATDPITGKQVSNIGYTYQANSGMGFAYVVNNSISNISFGMDKSWVYTGTTRDRTLYYDVKGVNFDYLSSIDFRQGSEKVMLIFSDNNSLDYTYTNPAKTGYSFMGINNTVKKFVQDNNMAVYTVVPDSILSYKFNANNNNTNITCQTLSLSELVSTSQARGKVLDSNWSSSLKYLKYKNFIPISSVKINNNTVRVTFSDAVSDDILATYFPNLNNLKDTVGNPIADLYEQKITEQTGTPSLLNGLCFCDAIEPINNDYTIANLGSPSVAGNTYRYYINATTPMATPVVGSDLSTWTVLVNGQKINTSNDFYIGVAEVDANNKLVRFTQAKAIIINE